VKDLLICGWHKSFSLHEKDLIQFIESKVLTFHYATENNFCYICKTLVFVSALNVDLK